MDAHRHCAEHHGAWLCPARRGISRSALDPQAVLSISDTPIPAKLLRLVCDTAAVRARVQQRSAAGSAAPGRFRADDGRQKLAGRARGRKRRRRFALPAQSMTRADLPGPSGKKKLCAGNAFAGN